MNAECGLLIMGFDSPAHDPDAVQPAGLRRASRGAGFQ